VEKAGKQIEKEASPYKFNPVRFDRGGPAEPREAE